MADANAIDIGPLTPDSDPEVFEGAFDVLCDVFVSSSVVHTALDVQMAPYRAYYRPYYESMVAEGLSLVAVDNRTSEVAGVIIGCDFVAADEHDAEEPGWISPLYGLLDELSVAYREREAAAKGEIVLVDMAAVRPAFEGRGIYQALRTAFHISARAAGYRKVIAELSSAATQAVCVGRFGHKIVNELAFADFVFEGTTPFASINEPPTLQLVEGSLI